MTKNLKELALNTPTEEELDVFFEELNGVTDRVAAITVPVIIQHDLIQFINDHYFIYNDYDLEEMGSIVQNFSTLINLSYGLGIISETQKSGLHIIRKIRNVFAHSVRSIDFTNPIITKEIIKLPSFSDGIPNFTIDDVSKQRYEFINYCFRVSLFIIRKNNIYRKRDFEALDAIIKLELEFEKNNLSEYSELLSSVIKSLRNYEAKGHLINYQNKS